MSCTYLRHNTPKQWEPPSSRRTCPKILNSGCWKRRNAACEVIVVCIQFNQRQMLRKVRNWPAEEVVFYCSTAHLKCETSNTCRSRFSVCETRYSLPRICSRAVSCPINDKCPLKLLFSISWIAANWCEIHLQRKSSIHTTHFYPFLATYGCPNVSNGLTTPTQV